MDSTYKPVLPKGWDAKVDEHGRFYYVDNVTGKTTVRDSTVPIYYTADPKKYAGGDLAVTERLQRSAMPAQYPTPHTRPASPTKLSRSTTGSLPVRQTPYDDRWLQRTANIMGIDPTSTNQFDTVGFTTSFSQTKPSVNEPNPSPRSSIQSFGGSPLQPPPRYGLQTPSASAVLAQSAFPFPTGTFQQTSHSDVQFGPGVVTNSQLRAHPLRINYPCKPENDVSWNSDSPTRRRFIPYTGHKLDSRIATWK